VGSLWIEKRVRLDDATSGRTHFLFRGWQPAQASGTAQTKAGHSLQPDVVQAGMGFDRIVGI
jgi:hypothetical protein